MANNSKIEWTDATWNPIAGCTPCSPGCANCYARTMTKRLQAMGQKKYAAGFDKVVCHEDALAEPLRWRTPRRIFVCSMSDLFHEDVPFEFIDHILNTVLQCSQHKFMLLTKRANRMKEYFDGYKNLINESGWPFPMPNLHLGVTVCNQAEADEKIPLLVRTPAAVRFVCHEPALEEIRYSRLKSLEFDNLYLNAFTGLWAGPHSHGPQRISGCDGKIDWLIAGGESGPKARPTHPDIIRSDRDQCVAAGVPFFFKQWGEWVPGCLNGSKECYVFQNCDIIDRNLSLRLKEAHERQWKLWDDNYRCISRRVGKARAGRLLDGREWNELPGKIYPLIRLRRTD